MLFRIWNKENKNWIKDANITSDNDAFLLVEVNYPGYTQLEEKWLHREDYDIEFNTGITLADGTKTFFGDIVRWKDSMFDRRGGDGYRYWVLEPERMRLPWVWTDLMDEVNSNVFDKCIELVGNIHETELTDAMKVWIS